MTTDGIVPDTKDWTWVLGESCPECGFDARGLDRVDLADRIRANVGTWSAILAQPDAAVRPDQTTWSPLEYACHVRDVHRIFGERVGRMLSEETPTFANWDQDETALAERYGEQDPSRVSVELAAAAEAIATIYQGVPDDAWGRRGIRSNGSEFTVDSIGRYHLHDVEHHAWDVRAAVARAVVAAYHADALPYAQRVPGDDAMWAAWRAGFAADVGVGGRVLEIGSGGGHDAFALEAAGLTVRRTDITPGFVALMRADGREAEVLDPLHDELADPRSGESYDGVFASASLLHVDRHDLPVVLARLAQVTRRGGHLAVSLKTGSGDAWSTHGHVQAPRRFVFWEPGDLVAVLADAGWSTIEQAEHPGQRGESWVLVRAVRD